MYFIYLICCIRLLLSLIHLKFFLLILIHPYLSYLIVLISWNSTYLHETNVNARTTFRILHLCIVESRPQCYFWPESPERLFPSPFPLSAVYYVKLHRSYRVPGVLTSGRANYCSAHCARFLYLVFATGTRPPSAG